MSKDAPQPTGPPTFLKEILKIGWQVVNNDQKNARRIDSHTKGLGGHHNDGQSGESLDRLAACHPVHIRVHVVQPAKLVKTKVLLEKAGLEVEEQDHDTVSSGLVNDKLWPTAKIGLTPSPQEVSQHDGKHVVLVAAKPAVRGRPYAQV